MQNDLKYKKLYGKASNACSRILSSAYKALRYKDIWDTILD